MPSKANRNTTTAHEGIQVCIGGRRIRQASSSDVTNIENVSCAGIIASEGTRGGLGII